MSDKKCPECGAQLGERSANLSSNVKRREIESIWDRYVCRSCDTTWSRREIESIELDSSWFWS